MGIFSCLSRPKTVDAVDGDNSIFIDGMDMKDGASVGGSPGRRARAAGSDSLSSSPRKQRIDYDALVKAKQMPGTALHAVATATGAPGTTGNVELANARALVRSLARKPESRRTLSRLLVLDGRDKLEMWWVEEGYLTELSSVLMALEEAKTRDRLYIPSRYQLFTLNQVRQGVKAAEEAATQAAAAAQAAESGGNAVETTSKAALAALRCSQAANAAAAAEGNAMGSANHARIEQSMASLAAAMAAMALFQQAKDAAYLASTSANRAANATWLSLEKVTALYTSTRQYYMLDDLVEASAAAKKAMALSKEATIGWGAGSMQGRQHALAACKQAAEAAELCHRELVNVFKMNS